MMIIRHSSSSEHYRGVSILCYEAILTEEVIEGIAKIIVTMRAGAQWSGENIFLIFLMKRGFPSVNFYGISSARGCQTRNHWFCSIPSGKNLPWENTAISPTGRQRFTYNYTGRRECGIDELNEESNTYKLSSMSNGLFQFPKQSIRNKRSRQDTRILLWSRRMHLQSSDCSMEHIHSGLDWYL